jgi:hypothetical protein
MDHGDAAQVEQVLAGATVAGAAASPVPDVGEGVLDLDPWKLRERQRRRGVTPCRPVLSRASADWRHWNIRRLWALSDP